MRRAPMPLDMVKGPPPTRHRVGQSEGLKALRVRHRQQNREATGLYGRYGEPERVSP